MPPIPAISDGSLGRPSVNSRFMSARLPKRPWRALRYIGVLATGYNVVDLEAARRHDIVVTNIPAYSTLSVAQMVFAHLLNITHHVAQHAERVTNGAWQNAKDFCFWDSELIELDGLTLGIVGLGNIGRAVARIAQTFGMKVMAYSSKSSEALAEMGIQKAASYEDVFRTADVVSLHCPLNAQLIDEQALADALNEGRIYAAGVDVLTQEPPRAGSPLIGARNCYITPHVAWATRAARERLDKIAFDNVRAYLSGIPQNVVN